MVRKVRWSRSAQIDLQELFEYISESAPLNAYRLADKIRKTSDTLDLLSERGRVIPEFADQSLREIFVSRYRIMYQVLPKEIIITAVIHMSRDLQNIFPPKENS
jgi:toxin ParE1/3/4